MYAKFFPVLSQMAKFIFVSSTHEIAEKNPLFYEKTLLNHAHIFIHNREVIAGVFNWHKKFVTYYSFDGHFNVSKILFPDKTKNLEGSPLHVAFVNKLRSIWFNGKVYSKWTYFIEILAEKMNASLNFIEISNDQTSQKNYGSSTAGNLFKLYWKGNFDFFIESHRMHQLFQGYAFSEQCYVAPLPPKRSILELILFLPLDKSCWMWLGITFAISAFIWRCSEGPLSQWNFLFGMFALFVGKYSKVQA